MIYGITSEAMGMHVTNLPYVTATQCSGHESKNISQAPNHYATNLYKKGLMLPSTSGATLYAETVKPRVC